MIGVLRVVQSVELPQNQPVFRQRAGLVGEDKTHAAERFVERHGVAVHGVGRFVEVGVAVDEGGVEDLDEFERDFEAGGHHGDVEEEEAERQHQREIGHRGLHVPPRVALVQRETDGRQHEHQQDLGRNRGNGEPGGRR